MMRSRSAKGKSAGKSRGKRGAAEMVRQDKSSIADQTATIETLTRQLAETRSQLSEALEQQRATTDVLQAISASPGELGPVFETMLARATELCEAHYGTLWLREG